MATKKRPVPTGDIFEDISKFQEQFGFDTADVDENFLAHQIGFLQEELNETKEAFMYADAEGVIDGIVDLIVVAVGTLKFFTQYGHDVSAWKKVMTANMAKEVGFNDSRPDSGGIDLVKPKGWKPPKLASEAKFLEQIFLKSVADGSGNYHHAKLTRMLEGQGARASVAILRDCIEIHNKKAQDYSSVNSPVQPADYYPEGLNSFEYLIDVLKRNRQRSLIAELKANGKEPNYEGLIDTIKDRIIYLAMMGEWVAKQTPGQDTSRDLFNRPIVNASNEQKA